MRACDLGNQSVSPQQAELAADPGGAPAKLLFVVGSLGKEDGMEIAIAKTEPAPSDWEICQSCPDRSEFVSEARWARVDETG